MPYSLEKQFMMKIERETKKMLKQAKKDITNAVNEADTLTMAEIEQEAHRMYEKLITDYYEYKTRFYIRHGQDRVGTQTGENLYKSDNIHLSHGKLFLETNYKKMSAGYRDHSRNDVLEMIKGGERYMGRHRSPERWSGDYAGTYIDITDSYINQAFNEFEYAFDSMYDEIFDKNMNKLKGKYEFW